MTNPPQFGIENVEKVIDEKKAKEFEQKILSNDLNFVDFLVFTFSRTFVAYGW